MLRWNILQYLKKMLRQYFNCNEILEIFLTSFCNILCYVGCNATNYFLYNCYWLFLCSGVIGIAMVVNVTTQRIIAWVQIRRVKGPLYFLLIKLTISQTNPSFLYTLCIDCDTLRVRWGVAPSCKKWNFLTKPFFFVNGKNFVSNNCE